MHIYFSGLTGAGINPLAHVALDAGHQVSGSDLLSNQNLTDIKERGGTVFSTQTGQEIAEIHARHPIDWVVASAAIPPQHPETVFARDNAIRYSKRDEFINHILKEHNLKLIAVSGTHGKTTTSAMTAWLFKEMDVPVSHIIGTNLPFSQSGELREHSQWLVLEADEFDKNMLNFKPDITVLPSLDYDHPDTYPTKQVYRDAFKTFAKQSAHTITWKPIGEQLDLPAADNLLIPTDRNFAAVHLAGEHNRRNAWLAASAVSMTNNHLYDWKDLILKVSSFPGTQRRFEKLTDTLYTDYAHSPAEIAATLQLASELSSSVVVVYQPHQNIRQHELQGAYEKCFEAAQQVYWLPTYLSREDTSLEVLMPEKLLPKNSPDKFTVADKDESLIQAIRQHMKNNDLVVVMGAGDIDPWIRSKFND